MMVDGLGQVHIILTYDEYQDLMKYADDKVIEDGIINTIVIRATNSILSDIGMCSDCKLAAMAKNLLDLDTNE